MAGRNQLLPRLHANQQFAELSAANSDEHFARLRTAHEQAAGLAKALADAQHDEATLDDNVHALATLSSQQTDVHDKAFRMRLELLDYQLGHQRTVMGTLVGTMATVLASAWAVGVVGGAYVGVAVQAVNLAQHGIYGIPALVGYKSVLLNQLDALQKDLESYLDKIGRLYRATAAEGDRQWLAGHIERVEGYQAQLHRVRAVRSPASAWIFGASPVTVPQRTNAPTTQ